MAPVVAPSISDSVYSTLRSEINDERKGPSWRRLITCESAGDLTRVAIRTPRILVVVLR